MRKAFFLWELPQLFLASILYIAYRKKIIKSFKYKHAAVFVAKGFKGGISLSWGIIINPANWQKKIITHEYGHSHQSIFLGWLYLPLVGLPSIIRSIIWKKYHLDPKRYFSGFPENWADRLGNR